MIIMCGGEKEGGREKGRERQRDFHPPIYFPKISVDCGYRHWVQQTVGLGWEEDTEGDVTSERLSRVRDSLGVFPKENGSQFIDHQVI